MKAEDRFAQMSAFVETLRHASFASAAKALSLSPSAVSRRVLSLERRLGTRLLYRSTRHLKPTEAGELYFAECTRLLAELEDVDGVLSDKEGGPHGRLRMTVPDAFGRLCMLKVLPQFLKQYPGVDIDLELSDTYTNLVREGMDLAVRIGELTDSSLVARRLATSRRMLCASPDYLRERGEPTVPQELENHSCLGFSLLVSNNIWPLSRGQETVRVAVKGRMRANHAEALYFAALEGLGIALLSDFIAARSLERGHLALVLPQWSISEVGIYAVYPGGRQVPRKVRAMIDFLEKNLPKDF